MYIHCRDYIDALCEEINDSLQESGQMNVADISKSFSLPNNFLLEVYIDSPSMYKTHLLLLPTVNTY